MSQIVKQILAVLIGLGLIILIIVLIVRGFQSVGKSDETDQVEQQALVSYAATDTVATLTTQGPIVAEADYHATKIIVSRDTVTVDVTQGYQGAVIVHQTFANNQQSYATFLSALDLLGFTKGNTSESLADERGSCPAGSRFIYALSSSSNDISRFWSTTCGQRSGNFLGQASQVRSLFEAQVPKSARSQLLSYN